MLKGKNDVLATALLSPVARNNLGKGLEAYGQHGDTGWGRGWGTAKGLGRKGQADWGSLTLFPV